jgi:glycosyl transferase family 25
MFCTGTRREFVVGVTRIIDLSGDRFKYAMMIPPVFVITLNRETERRQNIAARLSSLGLNFEFFSATCCTQLTPENQNFYKSRLRRLQRGKELSPSEIACLYSHKRLIEYLVAQNIPQAIIMEDDCVVCDDFARIVHSLAQRRAVWHLVRFFGDDKHLRRRHRRIGRLTGDYWLARISTSPGGAHCYLLDQHAARQLSHALASVTVPVDILMGQPWNTGLAVLTVYPRVAWQDQAFASAIGDERFARVLEVQGLEKLAYRIWAPLTRLWVNFAKRWWYYKAWLADRRLARRWPNLPDEPDTP